MVTAETVENNLKFTVYKNILYQYGAHLKDNFFYINNSINIHNNNSCFSIYI